MSGHKIKRVWGKKELAGQPHGHILWLGTFRPRGWKGPTGKTCGVGVEGVGGERRKRNPKPSFAPIPQGLVSRGSICPFCRPQCLLLSGLKRVKIGLQVRCVSQHGPKLCPTLFKTRAPPLGADSLQRIQIGFCCCCWAGSYESLQNLLFGVEKCKQY